MLFRYAEYILTLYARKLSPIEAKHVLVHFEPQFSVAAMTEFLAQVVKLRPMR